MATAEMRRGTCTFHHGAHTQVLAAPHPMHIHRPWTAAALGSCTGPSQCHHCRFLSLLNAAPVFPVARHSPELPRKGDSSSFPLSVQLIHSHYLCFSSVTQSCPTLCNLMDCSTPGFPGPSPALRAYSN